MPPNIATLPDPRYLHAIVDMGSNGIRFSITNLAPPTTRILPTVYQDRAAISLYDAQYSSSSSDKKSPIPSEIIASVATAFRAFSRTCADFRVARENIRVLATEATRNAENSVELRAAIARATGGWEVTLLTKEDEGKLGAMGVASSFHEPRGLVMDLGGGSVQVSWMEVVGGQVKIVGSSSLPYGAAALLRRLENGGGEVQSELLRDIESAVKGVNIPKEALERGFELFLSGGGFRGWGYVLMDSHSVQPYPIPIINGFSVTRKEFLDADAVARHVQANADDIFRVSERRAEQVPAVSQLVTTLRTVLPSLSRVRFAQGGVREGALFSSLPPEIRKLHPLHVATAPLAPPDVVSILTLLQASIPPKSPCPQLVSDTALPAVANAMYFHSGLTKETRAAAALRCTSTGSQVAGAHGLQHEQRAILAWMLAERWGGEVSGADKSFREALLGLLTPAEAWWGRYVAKVAALVGEMYPAGRVTEERLKLGAKMHGAEVRLTVEFVGLVGAEEYSRAVKKIRQVGKKKKGWIGGKDGVGWKVDVDVAGAEVDLNGDEDE